MAALEGAAPRRRARDPFGRPRRRDDGTGGRRLGTWDAGRWKVVFRRPLKSLGDDAQFPTGKPLNIAFAVWDGGSGDRDGIKSVTFWHTVTLEP